MNETPQSVLVHNVYGFTAGGPLRKNRTFFFAGLQLDTLHSAGNFAIKLLPTDATITRLRSLFPSNPRLDLYLQALGNVRGSVLPSTIALGADPQTGVDRGKVLFGTGNYSIPAINDDTQWLIRLDHNYSDAHRLSWRYIHDARIISPDMPRFPGFVLEQAFSNQNLLFADSFTFGPNYTNKFRFSYGRLDADQDHLSERLSVPLARSLPAILFTNTEFPQIGASTNLQEFRHVNNFLFQETQTKVSGVHTFRYGAEFPR